MHTITSRRTITSASIMMLWLLAGSASAGQQNTPPPEPDQNTGISTLEGGQFDFGFRGTFFGDGSDEARYQRYRDLRTGVVLENFRWGKSDDYKYWDIRATHVGYRDQQYAANYNKFGKMKASFAYNQIPLFFSQDTRTAYTTGSPGVLGLDGFPAQVQSGAAKSTIYNDVATAFDLRLKRSITDFRFVYSLTDQLDLSGSFKNTQKTGEQPWAGTFGFSDAVELATPVDTRTTDVGVAAEWTNAVADPAMVEEAWSLWREEVAWGDRFVAEAPDFDVLSKRDRDAEPANLRSILVHLIEEYARHIGHADILREQIDGRVGQ